MVETELVFRGIDAEECTSFIWEVQKRAYGEGKLRDFAWMADLATLAFDGPALIWFDSQGREIQADWALLRRALLDHYCGSRTPPAPPPVDTTAFVSPSPAVSPSPRLSHIKRTERPRFHIRVVAPAYSGYISTTLASTDIGHVCTLTTNPSDALDWLQVSERIDELASKPCQIYSGNTVKDSLYEFLFALRSCKEPNGRLCSPLMLCQYSMPTRYPVSAGDGVRRDWGDVQHKWLINRDGRILLDGLDGPKVVIAKLQDGSLNLNIWTQRFWTEDDDAYIAHLYFVRVI